MRNINTMQRHARLCFIVNNVFTFYVKICGPIRGVKVLSYIDFFEWKISIFFKIWLAYALKCCKKSLSSRMMVFWLSSTLELSSLFSHNSQMDHTCKLHSKCLKEDDSLEKCKVRNARTLFIWLLQEINGNVLERMSGRVYCFVESTASSTTKSLWRLLQVKPK